MCKKPGATVSYSPYLVFVSDCLSRYQLFTVHSWISFNPFGCAILSLVSYLLCFPTNSDFLGSSYAFMKNGNGESDIMRNEF